MTIREVLWRRAVGYALLVLVILAMAVSASAQERIDAMRAFERAKAGELLIVDVRSRQEWRSTELAEGAVAISMHEPGFVDGIRQLAAANPGKPIALICASGGRSAAMQAELARAGFAGTIDIGEGMMGGSAGPGWIARGLPVVEYRQQ